MQEKDIIITNLTSKVISPKPGATWKAFTVYMIQGNDGVTYETTIKDFFDTLRLGQTAKIKFRVETKTSNGKVYTSYKIDLPKKSDPALGEMKTEILARIEQMEKNILAAIRLNATKKVEPVKTPEVNPGQLSLFPDDGPNRTLYEDDDAPEDIDY